MALLDGLGKFKDFGLLVIRVGLGLCFSLVHGIPKIMGGVTMWTKIGGAMGSVGIHFLPVFWGFMASGSEALGGILVMLGLFFRPACLFLVITMLIASLVSYAHGDGFGDASHAIEMGVVFLGLLFIGPGRYSVDRK